MKKWVFRAVISLNLLFICWILYNGMAENFEGTLPEKISYISLMLLLTANSVLLFVYRKKE